MLKSPVVEGPDGERRWLPQMGSWRYHLLLMTVGMGLLGPLCGLTAAYMNFSLGFFVSGQVLAGILGSFVTLGYGSEGRHGANYIQTVAASVAGMSAMGVLVQALVWLGLPQPPLIPLTLYMLSIGLFGSGVGMLYTPLLVDRMRLPFPSGLAVANILRALANPALLKRSAFQMAGGTSLGLVGGFATATLRIMEPLGLSMSTIGAGMVVGSRLAIPALTASLALTALMPVFIHIGWLHPGDPYRKVAFLLAMGAMLGAIVVDLSVMFLKNSRAWRKGVAATPSRQNPRSTSNRKLLLWTFTWATATALIGRFALGQPMGFLLLCIGLVFVFALINGIAAGVSDQSPVSAAFVIAVLVMAGLGLRDPSQGLLAGAILFIGTQVASDMQQDRSTGRRMGSDRTLQFRYQVSGILMGAIGAIWFARLFMGAYPVLRLDQTVLSAADQPAQWSSAMTYKFVGTLRSVTQDGIVQHSAMGIGACVGVVLQASRVFILGSRPYQRLGQRGTGGRALSWLVDVLAVPSPYALGFGAFVNVVTAAWFAFGGALGTFLGSREHVASEGAAHMPTDMSRASLLGGGLIAGEGLAALVLGVAGLASTLF